MAFGDGFGESVFGDMDYTTGFEITFTCSLNKTIDLTCTINKSVVLTERVIS